MIDAVTIAPMDRRWRDLQRAIRAMSADAMLAVVACRCIERRRDRDTRRVAEAHYATV